MNTAVLTLSDDLAAPARLLEQQRQADREAGAIPAEQRLAVLAALDRALRTNRTEIATAISADFGHRAHEETIMAEIVPALAAIRHARRHLRRWMRPERRRVDIGFRPGRAFVQWQPLGCVAIVSPWNYPLLLTVSPLVDAIAAGNRVIVKPSELVPRFSALFARLMAQVTDPLHVAVVTGGPAIGQAVCGLPLDHLLFTGSTAVGRLVARAAAETLTPVTLELGGKSPALVCPDFDLARAARTIAQGKLFNAGQTCIAPDYALVPQEQIEAFAAATMHAATAMYPHIAGNPDYTAIISARHAARLEELVQEAEAGGARVLRAPSDGDGQRFPPVILLDAPVDSVVMTEEIFGPILPVVGYRSLDEALSFIAARPRPLAFYPFTRDPTVLATVLNRTVSGGASVNTVIMHCIQDDLPFGGVGASGMGAYHGRDGFRRFSHARGVYQPGRFNALEFLAPPYGRKVRLALRAMLLR